MEILIKFLLPTALVAVTLSHKECFRSLQQRLKAELLISSVRNYHMIPVGSRDLSTPPPMPTVLHYTISLGTVPVRYGDYGRLGTRLSGTAVNLNKERKVSENSV